MTTKKTGIVDAAERAKKLGDLVAAIKQVQQNYCKNPNTVMGRAIAHGAMVAHYYLNPDPVIWIASLRSDVGEIERFIEECKEQVAAETATA